MRTENTIKAFYNKFPYPSASAKTAKDLLDLPFQKKLLKITRKYLTKGKVLDAGCGTGELALLLDKEGFHSFGTDISEKSLKIARGTSRRLSIPTSLRKMDILDLKFPIDFFDIAIANGVLHHTKKPVFGFENLVRVTKPGGIIIVVVYNRLGSIPRRLLGKAARVLGGTSKEKRIAFLRKFLGKKYARKSDSVIADAFFNPYETAFSIQEVLKWFEKYNIKYLESAPSVGKVHNPLTYLLVEITWMLTLRGNVFIMVGEKQ